MTFHHSDLLQTAKLARIALSESSGSLSPAAFAENIEQILSMVDQISAVDTNGITPMHHPLEVTQPVRMDEVQENALLKREELLKLAPDKEAGLLLVPTVIEE